MSSSFKAKYDGRCPACGEEIQAGDLLESRDDEAVHTDCVDHRAAAKLANRPTCSECWETISVSGACGCDPT